MSNSKNVTASDARPGNPGGLLIPPDRPFIPCLPSDRLMQSPPQSLAEYREIEGRDNRKRRLLQIWQSLPDILKQSPIPPSIDNGDSRYITFEKMESLKTMYDRELLLLCNNIPASGSRESHAIGWGEFKMYAESKEAELWHIFHDELDQDGNGHLDHKELHSALSKAGIALSPSTVSEFIMFLSTEPHSSQISFGNFRDFLILLPRKVSLAEIYQYYEVKKYMGDDECGPARVNNGDVGLSAEGRRLNSRPLSVEAKQLYVSNELNHEFAHGEEEEEREDHHFLEGCTALKFLLAGGVAGAVSRTCTAPFDRLKIFLITRPPELGGPSLATANAKVVGVKTITNAVAQIYSEGGILAFWTGNGLSVAKIFPESAIKFFAYESSKRAFAKYWDKVEDSRDISGISRFLSGGIGGLSSQLSIYPIETLKTQMMSSTGLHKRTLAAAARHLWAIGGMHAYYRGLSIGLVGVFPYSAIDMSTFEALKLAYQQSTGKQEPGVLALLAFGSISGSVGATSVYPLNFVRTRLQASGSSGHPQIYAGVWDVVAKTWEREGWKGFYRGLFPTLAKVVPAVSISYVVYEHAKRRLGV